MIYPISSRLTISAQALSLLLFTAPYCPPVMAQAPAKAPVALHKLGAYDRKTGAYLGLLSDSDTLISIPVTRPPEFTGAIQSVSAAPIVYISSQAHKQAKVTLSATPIFASGQFVYSAGKQPKTYYARLGPNSSKTNPKEGFIYAVRANDQSSVTLDLNSDDISTVPQGTEISLIPYWTLATVFPSSDEDVSFTPTSVASSPRTQILVPDYSGARASLSFSKTYLYMDKAWRLAGDSLDHGDDVLRPDGFFVVRNQNGAATGKLTLAGSVVMRKIAVALSNNRYSPVDNAVSITRSVAVSLRNSGLSPSDGSFLASPSASQMKDQLFVYDNQQTGINKSPAATYYQMNGAWRLFGDSGDHGDDLISPGSAILIRKAATIWRTSNYSPNFTQTVNWTNTPTY